MRIKLNGQITEIEGQPSVAELLAQMGIEPMTCAVEVNVEIVRRDERAVKVLKEGDEVEIVKMIAGGRDGRADGQLTIAGKSFRSRLFLGTGRYPSFDHMRRCHEASGCELVTLAVARHDLGGPKADNILDFIDRNKFWILPNTAGAYTAKEAIRLAKLARELLGTEWIKLEVLGDPNTLWPDVTETVAACAVLVKDGFTVLPYTSDDPLVAKRLEDEGAAAIMPLGAMIGSGQGLLNPFNLELIKSRAKVPVICDAGIGTASDAAAAMELGLDGCLLNTAVAQAQDPIMMAKAMGLAVEAGRLAFVSGRIPKRDYAQASSPGAGLKS